MEILKEGEIKTFIGECRICKTVYKATTKELQFEDNGTPKDKHCEYCDHYNTVYFVGENNPITKVLLNRKNDGK